jgi:hypothetical protein
MRKFAVRFFGLVFFAGGKLKRSALSPAFFKVFSNVSPKIFLTKLSVMMTKRAAGLNRNDSGLSCFKIFGNDFNSPGATKTRYCFDGGLGRAMFRIFTYLLN